MIGNKDIKLKLSYEDPQSMGNLAEKLDGEERQFVGAHVQALIQNDIMSRQDWIEAYSAWLKLAAQVKEEKSYPWPKASNVKYPLVTLASIQFHARSLPNIINSGQPVKAAAFGEDPEGEKQYRANRVEKHMSWQLMFQMENWHNDTDRLLYVLPIAGTVYRKMFYSNIKQRPDSRLILPQDLIINYHAKTVETARRTEVMELTSNQVRQMERSGFILEVDQLHPTQRLDGIKETTDMIDHVTEVGAEEDVPYEIWECHWELDLDNDGYKEPYVITLNAQDGQLLSIYPRWGRDAVQFNDKKQIVDIKGDQHYVDYHFLPSPDSATHGVGFGHLLGPLNESTNTVINQLLDAGHLATLQCGFFARNVRIPGDKLRFQPGEWRQVNVAGGDLKNGIFPLPVKEPSTALFNLLQFLVQAGERIASISDIMLGENPGQNQPASTTMAVLEQGLKVFTGIYGRIHRAMGKEYRLLFNINKEFHNVEEEARLLDDGVPANVLSQDYEDQNLDIQVASDPNMVTDAQRLLKAQSLMEKIQFGVNPQFAIEKMLIAEGYTKDEIQQAMQPPPPPPIPPDIELKMREFEHNQKVDLMRLEDEQTQTKIKGVISQAQAILAMAKAQAEGQKVDIDKFRAAIEAYEAEQTAVNDRQMQQYDKVEKVVGMRKTMEEIKTMGKEASQPKKE